MCRREGQKVSRVVGARYVIPLIAGLIAFPLLITSWSARAQSTLPTWNCSPDGFLFQGNPSSFFSVELITGESNAEATNFHPQAINSVGYNILDDYVYGFTVGTTPFRIVRVGRDASVESVGRPTGVAATGHHIGDIDENGHYWLANGNDWYQIDLEPGSPNYMEVITSGSKSGLSFADWAYVPNGNNSLYAVANGTNQHLLYRFDRGTKQFHNLGGLGSLGDGGGFGAAYADPNGFLYVSQNSTGQIHRIDIDDVSATLFANGPASGQNDGVRCFAAPILLDFGDAPSDYGTLLVDNGPRHGLRFYDDVANTAELMLGTSVNPEDDGLPGALADGDGADDGVSAPIEIVDGMTSDVTVTVTNNSTDPATLAGWIDLNGNGTFDAGERAVETVPANSGADDYLLSFPAAGTSTATTARFRVLSGNVAAPTPLGPQASGEVEDYAVLAGQVRYEKAVSPSNWTDLNPGEDLTYTVTVSNEGGVDLTGLSFADDLSDVVDDATYNNDVTASAGTAMFNAPNEIAWSGDLLAGQTATITYSVTIDTPPGGDGIAINAVVGEGPGSNCPAGSTDPACFKQIPQPQLSSEKTSMGPANPTTGDTISYQFTVTNSGPVPAASAVVTDDLSGVLDDASYNNDATASSGSVTFDAAAERLVWNGALAAGGASATVEYSVTVNNSLGDGVLNNALLSTDCPDPAIFDPGALGYDASCVTTSAVEAWMATKTSDGSGTSKAGDIITYTLLVENTGGANLAGLSVSDDLTAVIDDATYNGDASASVGTATYTQPTVTWNGDLAVGQSATITYSVEVNRPDGTGDREIINAVVGSPNCPNPAITDPDDPDFVPTCATIDNAAIPGGHGIPVNPLWMLALLATMLAFLGRKAGVLGRTAGQ